MRFIVMFVTAVCVLFLIKLRWPKKKNFYDTYQIVKSEKYEKFCASKLLIWRQEWAAGVRHGTSLVVRRVSSGRPIVVLF